MNKHALPEIIVGIDIETTGLEPALGEIIEVAAVRFNTVTGKEVDRFETLLSASEPISSHISVITNITNEMVSGKPRFSEVVEDLQRFIGDDILFAHNASFDIGFLTHHGLQIKSGVIDTFVLAAIAWPTAPSYNLGTLAEEYNIPRDGEHRAASDVIMTWHLLLRATEQLNVSQECYNQVQVILDKSKTLDYLPFFRAKTKNDSQPEALVKAKKDTEVSEGERAAPLTLGSVFNKEKGFAYSIPGYKHRPQQVKMAEHVKRNLDETGILLIEAGTGTGKTFAYLVPGLLSIEDGSITAPLVISTYTKTLQDQLVDDDLPKLSAMLGKTWKVATLKGRKNYVCRWRLEAILQRDSFSPAEAALLIKILVWLDHGGAGDLERINISHQDSGLLRVIHADAIACREHCSATTGCYYHKHKELAKNAQVVVVNHSLLAQLSVSNEELVPLKHLIIDEAHHLESAMRSATGLDFSMEKVMEIVGPLLKVCREEKTLHAIDKIREEGEEVLQSYKTWLENLAQYTRDQTQYTVRLSPVTRKGSKWHALSVEGVNWLHKLKFFTGLVKGVHADELEHAHNKRLLAWAFSETDQFSVDMQQFIDGDSKRIQWLELSYDQKRVFLKDVALQVHAVTEQMVHQAVSIVFTSATLTVNADYSFIKQRLGLTEAEEVILASPYDYDEQMLVYVVEDAPYPSGELYDSYVAQIITDIALITSGRVLGLFTSHKSVQNVFNIASKELSKANIKTLAQRLTGGRRNITQRFKDVSENVLLGTNSFWEGVDIPGDSLSCVVIPKMPFPMMGDPVIESLTEHFGSGEAFEKLTIPLMSIRLRQGVGRLIRSEQDRGVVVILDSRMVKKSYGRNILKELQTNNVQVGPQKNLVPVLKKWFGDEALKKWKSDHQKK